MITRLVIGLALAGALLADALGAAQRGLDSLFADDLPGGAS